MKIVFLLNFSHLPQQLHFLTATLIMSSVWSSMKVIFRSWRVYIKYKAI